MRNKSNEKKVNDSFVKGSLLIVAAIFNKVTTAIQWTRYGSELRYDLLFGTKDFLGFVMANLVMILGICYIIYGITLKIKYSKKEK